RRRPADPAHGRSSDHGRLSGDRDCRGGGLVNTGAGETGRSAPFRGDHARRGKATAQGTRTQVAKTRSCDRITIIPMKNNDLKANVGEGTGSGSVSADTELLKLVSSANISCGAHAGDLDTIQAVIEQAILLQCALGAHPSFPDRENFGRFELDLP